MTILSRVEGSGKETKHAGLGFYIFHDDLAPPPPKKKMKNPQTQMVKEIRRDSEWRTAFIQHLVPDLFQSSLSVAGPHCLFPLWGT